MTSFSWPPSLSMARKPTPIQPMRRWSQHIAPFRLWLKRDDLTGLLLSGNKVRKLEFLVREALDQNAEILITCGGLQSNHARTTAALAAQLGRKCHLVLKGDPPTVANGNFFLDKLLGAEISYITAEEYANASLQIMEKLAEAYNQKGLRAYVIPEGASCALGAFGYARVIEEIKVQSAELGVQFDAIVCATGSGGTQAGLMIGTKLVDYSIPIIGINVCDDAEFFRRRITTIFTQVEERFHLRLPITPSDICIIDGYVGEGYGKTSAKELSLLVEFARSEGIALEPVYTAKAMYGLMEEIKKGRFAGMRDILFIHTGGMFGLFPYAEQILKLETVK